MMKNFLAKIQHFKRKLYRNPRPSLNSLDRKLEKYLDFRNGFFIEVGANDGYSQSNTYFLEKKLGWKGLLVEGIPDLYEKCKKLRRESIVWNCALVSNDYQNSFVRMQYANLMSVVDGAKSAEDQKLHIKAGLSVQDIQETYSVDVPARTLESVLDELSGMSKIDFFSLDVEGYELEVLKGMNLSKYRPQYILVEANFFETVNRFLLSNEYMLVEKMSTHDYLYIDKGCT